MRKTAKQLPKRRGNGAGTLIQQASGLYLAKWTYQGKTYVRSTKTHNRDEAERLLNEFTKPFLESSSIAVMENLKARVATEILTTGVGQKIVEIHNFIQTFFADVNVQSVTDATVERFNSVGNVFERFVKANFPSVKYLHQVTEPIARSFLEDLKTKVLSSTYNDYLMNLKRIWTVLVKKENVWYEFKSLHSDDQHTKRSLTKDEVQRILKHVEKDKELRIAFNLGVYTGMRMSDCCLLKWKSIDFENNVIRILPKKVKRFHRTISVPIHPTLFNILLERYNEMKMKGNVDPDGYVSTINAQYYRTGSFRRTVGRELIRCGVKEMTGDYTGFHILRHNFVSQALNSGVPLAIVQSIVGHSAVEMTLHYFHQDEDAAKQAINGISFVN